MQPGPEVADGMGKRPNRTRSLVPGDVVADSD